jgi:hypothetical protein
MMRDRSTRSLRRSLQVGLAAFALTVVGFVPLEMLGSGSANAAPAFTAVPNVNLVSVACWTTTSCVAVGGYSPFGVNPDAPAAQPVVVPIANGVPGTPQILGNGNLLGSLESVACEPTTTTCYATGGGNADYLVPIVNGVAGTTQVLSTVGAFGAITCTSSTQCLIVGGGFAATATSPSEGLILPLSSGTPGTPEYVSDGGLGGQVFFHAVACPTPTHCVATGGDQSVPALQRPAFGVDVPIASGVPGTLMIDQAVNIIANGACPTTTSCQFATLQNSSLDLAVVPTDGNGDFGTAQVVPGGDSPTFAGSIVCPSSPSTCSLLGVGTNMQNQSIIVPLINGTPGTPVVVQGTSGTLSGTCPTSSSCIALSNPNNAQTQTLQADVISLTPPTTNVGIPSNGATLSGSVFLDAAAADGVGVTSVSYVLSGGSYSHTPVASAGPTYYGWIGGWNTTTVPNGTYTLQSVATNAEGLSTTSAPITVTVANPPTTFITIPTNGAMVSGTQLLDAGASTGVTKVVFQISGGPLNGTVIATATATYYGWLGEWNTKAVTNGSYTIQSVASYASGPSGTSAGVTVTVSN